MYVIYHNQLRIVIGQTIKKSSCLVTGILFSLLDIRVKCWHSSITVFLEVFITASGGVMASWIFWPFIFWISFPIKNYGDVLCFVCELLYIFYYHFWLYGLQSMGTCSSKLVATQPTSTCHQNPKDNQCLKHA